MADYQFRENEEVYTEHGKGTVVAQFANTTICVRLDSGGGLICLPSEVRPRFARITIPGPKRRPIVVASLK